MQIFGKNALNELVLGMRLVWHYKLVSRGYMFKPYSHRHVCSYKRKAFPLARGS